MSDTTEVEGKAEKQESESFAAPLWGIIIFLSFIFSLITQSLWTCEVFLLICVWLHPDGDSPIFVNRLTNILKYPKRIGLSILFIVLMGVNINSINYYNNLTEPKITILSSLHAGKTENYTLRFSVE